VPVLDRLTAVRRRLDAPPPPVVDVLIAVLCYLATVAFPLKMFRAAGWPLFLLAGLASLPLLWRRRAPVLVAAVVGAGTVGLAADGIIRDIQLPYGQLVATYTVAALAAPVGRLLVVAVTGAATVVSVLVLLDYRISMLGLTALPFVVAYALGTGVRARRDRIAMLEERTRRLAEAAEATAARERERIAREIHDIVAHSVSLMVVQAEAGVVVAADRDKAAGTFETISDTGREALTQLDRALGVLRGPAPVDGAGRQPAPGLAELPDLMDRARQAGLVADLREDGERRAVPTDLAAAVYRIVQEAVTNTVKHAGARCVRVRLHWRDAALAVTVEDDGRGPAPARPAGGPATAGRGLAGMRERVDAFGGDLTAGPGAAGFRVAAVFPLDGRRG
jgi:signal transduction histidine kinase